MICFAFPFTILEVSLLPEKQGQREWERRVTNMFGSKIERKVKILLSQKCSCLSNMIILITYIHCIEKCPNTELFLVRIWTLVMQG